MKKLLLLFIFLAAHHFVFAQNWRTVSKDTSFFGIQYAPDNYRIDSNLLRTMWVDSARAIGTGDSIFYFFRGIRIDTPNANCQDTMAASWLGPQMIRKPDGTEYYFGRRGDTIRFQTLAGLGDHWIIAQDASGTEFQGTVTSLSTTLVDGVVDSLKTISIQALRSGVPISDPYNSRVFQLSKSHGWTQTLDMFRFTSNRNATLGNGIQMLPEQHQRISSSFGAWNAGLIDVAWRYAAGNDFITVHEYGTPGGKDPAPTIGGNQVITHDSVLDFFPISASRAIVAFQTSSYSHLWKFTGNGPTGYADTVISASYRHTDTIQSEPGQKVRTFELYESVAGPIRLSWPSGFQRKYFLDSLNDGRFSLEEYWTSSTLYLFWTGACWKWMVGSPDPEAHIRNWIQDFGLRMSFNYFGSPTPPMPSSPKEFDRVEVAYAKLPGLTWGVKQNVLTLGMNEAMSLSASLFTIQPNPANNQINISSIKYQKPVWATLRNIMGQNLRQWQFTGSTSISVSDLPSGLYFLRIEGDAFRQDLKLIIQQ